MSTVKSSSDASPVALDELVHLVVARAALEPALDRQAEHRDRRGGALRVERADAIVAEQLRRGARALDRARELACDVQRENPLVAGELLVDGQEVARRRLRGRGRLGSRAQARVERGGVELDVVACSSRRRSARRAERPASSGSAAAPRGSRRSSRATIAVFSAVSSIRPPRAPRRGSPRRSRPALRPCSGTRPRRPRVSASRSRRFADAVRQTTATSGAGLEHRPRRLHAVEPGEPVVHQHDVRAQLARHAAAPPSPSETDATTFDVRAQPEEQLERFAEDVVVLDEDDADRLASSAHSADSRSG